MRNLVYYVAMTLDGFIARPEVNPIVFGEGIPLFARSLEAGRLVLGEVKRFDSGHLIVDYRVMR